jgi:hypothetical protein
MYKDGVLTIADWYKGQVKHPIYGFGLLQNVEVFENRGIAKVKNRAVARSITPNQLPIAEVRDIYGNVYTLTGDTGLGGFYKNGTLVQSGLANCWDLAIYQDYVWIRQSTKLSCYGPLSSSPQYFTGVATGFTDGYNGKLLVGQDDYLYSANGNYIAKIIVSGGGTPYIAPTASVTLASLDLPDGQFVSTLVEFGKNIIAGTHGGATYSDRGNSPIARLYPWNRQAGTLGNPGLADLPVVFNENGVNAVIQHANKLYVQAGTHGNVYVSDGTNYRKIATLPYARSGITSNSTVYANAMSISAEGTLLIGVSGYGDGYSKSGVYEIDINDPEYPVSYRTISTLSTGLSSVLKIGFLNQTDYQTLNIGWADASTYGVDETDFRMYASYGGVIESGLVKVGTVLEPKTFEHIEFCLAEPLVSGQNIRISYRKNSKDFYTTIGTWGYSAIGEVTSYEDNALIADAEYVQLKIELDQSLSTVYGSNINLISVRLW